MRKGGHRNAKITCNGESAKIYSCQYNLVMLVLVKTADSSTTRGCYFTWQIYTYSHSLSNISAP
ncbi:MAG: hypothetical protein ABIY51_01860, partial [Ferruginibacter sp.]